ncbi:hypothetical protein JCGZ_02879 [Jatropha curcas]|uniref:Uncharacterized protein n=1 Tax=Jatropha curcas TaxID=180498 RepID=A0A067JR14_JATCU|nr:hypothetical protein JCGZ_02879 [Jatropha curcas]
MDYAFDLDECFRILSGLEAGFSPASVAIPPLLGQSTATSAAVGQIPVSATGTFVVGQTSTAPTTDWARRMSNGMGHLQSALLEAHRLNALELPSKGDAVDPFLFCF